MTRTRKHTKEIRVWVTPELDALLGEKAGTEGRSKSDFVRRLLEGVLSPGQADSHRAAPADASSRAAPWGTSVKLTRTSMSSDEFLKDT
jgi:hypothetical protein